ncbi:MAG TPA: hypothetical protein VHW00_25655 [Thermoanaerobaculia bacterium]|nr:hypothetical protein [Thermoanaerobaculia bacterium]
MLGPNATKIAAASYGCTQAGAFVEPSAVFVMRPNTTAEVKVKLCYGPAAVPWDIGVGGPPPSVASGAAKIDYRTTETTLRITASEREGFAQIFYVVPQFGRAPAVRTIGTVYVSNPRRRAVR